jgi:hypothetical protein
MRERALRLLSALGRRLLRTAVRVVVTWLIFAVCLAAVLRYMGVPVPGPAELLEQFESVSRLAEILS